jgi:hypothetical protein
MAYNSVPAGGVQQGIGLGIRIRNPFEGAPVKLERMGTIILIILTAEVTGYCTRLFYHGILNKQFNE